MRILVAMAMAMLLFGGCATTPIRSSEAVRVPQERLLAFQERTEKTTSTITITRDVGFTGSVCHLTVRINGTDSARFGVGETSSFYVQPGEVLLGVGFVNVPCGTYGGHIKTRETILRPNEVKFFRLIIEPSGNIDIIRSDVE